MSLAYKPLTPILVENPVTQVNQYDVYAVEQSGSQITLRNFTTTNIANNQISWSCPPPSGQTYTDRMAFFTIPIRLEFSGTLVTTNGSYAPSSSLLNAGKDAPRFMPFASMTDTLTVTINSTPVTIPLADVVHALSRYNLDEELTTREWSMSPAYKDQSQNYGDLFGTNRNPLGQYGNSIENTNVPRGGFAFTIVSNAAVTPTTSGGTAATAVVDMVISEWIMVSPFFSGKQCDDNAAFYNTTQIDIYANFSAGAGFRAWSHNPLVSTSGADSVSSNITGAVVSFSNFQSPSFSYSQTVPLVQFKFLTPNVLSTERLGANMPINYPYYSISRYTTQVPAMAYGSTITQTLNSFQINQIPRALYIYARPSNTVLQTRCDITDCYYPISAVDVQFANSPDLLSSATQQQLYQIAVSNGSNQSWEEWSGQRVQNSFFPPVTGNAQYGLSGGPLCLRPGKDIQIQPNQAAGLGGQFTIQIKIQISNVNVSGAFDNLPISLYCIAVTEGVFTITGLNSATSQTAVLSEFDILGAQQKPGVTYREVERYRGGDLFGTLSDFASKVHSFVKDNKLISKIAPLIPLPGTGVISAFANELGYGEGMRGRGGIAVGGKMVSKKHVAKGIYR